jgi:DNA-binding transcriptional MocR family regulator
LALLAAAGERYSGVVNSKELPCSVHRWWLRPVSAGWDDVFNVVRKSSKPLGDQLVEEVTRLVISGRLPEGSRLPSVRQLARRSGVSTYTVSQAFERVVAKGLVQARPGSGYFVARLPRKPASARVELDSPKSVDPVLGFARSTMEQDNVVVPAGSGFLPLAWLAEAVPPSIYSKLHKNAAATESASVQGDLALRELLAERLRTASIPVAAGNLIVTFGASHAFDLIATTLLSPGDAVLIDDPGYFVLPAQLKAHGVQLIPVPRLADGCDLDALDTAAKIHRPRMFFTQTLLHNPTGTSASAANCHGVLKIAERYDFLVTEDHIFSDLAGPNAVSLAQIDELQRVIYVGSFTKLLGPGLRVGYIAARTALLAPFIEAKILNVLTGSALCEVVLREVLASGKYRRHIERLRDRISKSRAMSAYQLGEAGLTLQNPSGEGIFIWAMIPPGIDLDRLVLEAQSQGILLAKGSLFSPTAQSRNCLRFNVAYGADPLLIKLLSNQVNAAA